MLVKLTILVSIIMDIEYLVFIPVCRLCLLCRSLVVAWLERGYGVDLALQVKLCRY